MSSRQQQVLVGELQSYFQQKSEKVTKEEVSPIGKLAESFAKGNRAPQFVKLTFSCFKKQLKKQHFGLSCSRFLKLVDELLQLSGRVPVFKPYIVQVSRAIVDVYLFVFTMIFQYQILQSALNWKIYRMLWAKLITDDAFDTIRLKIAEKFNKFDLNRGFNAENIERIKRRYTRKGFTEAEISRYLDSSKLELKKSSSVEPIQEPGLHPQKKRNIDMAQPSISPGSGRQNPKEPNPIPRSYSPFEAPIHPAHFQQSYPNNAFVPKDPYYYPQGNSAQPYANYGPPQPETIGYGYAANAYLNPLQNYPIAAKSHINANMRQPNYAYLPQPPTNYPPTMLPNLGMQMGYGVFTPSMSPNNFNIPPSANLPTNSANMAAVNQPSELSKMHGTADSYQDKTFLQAKEAKPAKNQPHKPSNPHNAESIDTLVSKQLRLSLISYLHQCRECGLLVQTKPYLDQHVQSHLFEAQHEYFRKESESMGQTKPSNPRPNGYLLSADRWVNCNSGSSRPYQISIAGLQREAGKLTYHCYFCQQQLAIVWCEQLQDWTLKDTIKLKTDQEITVSHFSCFYHFSPDTSTP